MLNWKNESLFVEIISDACDVLNEIVIEGCYLLVRWEIREYNLFSVSYLIQECKQSFLILAPVHYLSIVVC